MTSLEKAIFGKQPTAKALALLLYNLLLLTLIPPSLHPLTLTPTPTPTPTPNTDAKDAEEDLGAEILRSSTDDILNRIKLLENDIKVCTLCDSYFVALDMEKSKRKLMAMEWNMCIMGTIVFLYTFG